jgi:hypothetical protein
MTFKNQKMHTRGHCQNCQKGVLAVLAVRVRASFLKKRRLLDKALAVLAVGPRAPFFEKLGRDQLRLIKRKK